MRRGAWKLRLPYLILTIVVIVLDQIVKVWVRGHIEIYDEIPFLPGIMDLTYWQNTGAAFSSFSAHTWPLAVVSMVVAALLLFALLKGLFPRPFGCVALALVLGGAVGNLIDRVALGYVTDMFMTTFINFAIFNVADICVVAGGVMICVHILFFYDKTERKKKEAGDGSPDADG